MVAAEQIHRERNPELVKFMLELTSTLAEQIEAEENQIVAEAGEESSVIDVTEGTALAGGCSALARQLDAMFKKVVGNMYLIFYKAEPQIRFDKYWEIPSASDTTTSQLYNEISDVKPIELNNADTDVDMEVINKVGSDKVNNVFPLVWLCYYVHKSKPPWKGTFWVSDKKSDGDAYYERRIADDRKKREGYIQCLKLVLTSVSLDTPLESSRDIPLFTQRCNLAVAFFGSMITGIARMVLTRKRASEARKNADEALRRNALLGEIPHNIKSHIADHINERNVKNLSKIRTYLKDRATYLEYMAKYSGLEANQDKRINFVKDFAEEYSLLELISNFKELGLLVEQVAIPESKDKADEQDQRRTWHKIFHVKGDALLRCINLRGAVENAIENLCINSLKHGQYDKSKLISNFSIIMEVIDSGNDIVLKHRNTGARFPEQEKDKVQDWLQGVNVDFAETQKGQGIWSIGLSIQAVGGSVTFDKKTETFTCKIPRDMVKAVENKFRATSARAPS